MKFEACDPNDKTKLVAEVEKILTALGNPQKQNLGFFVQDYYGWLRTKDSAVIVVSNI